MKVLVQWTTAQPTDWEEIDSSSWADLPFRPDPTGAPASAGVNDRKGWVHAINVQGVYMTGDHYAVEDLPDVSGCRVTTWTTASYGSRAKAWTFLPLAPDSAFNGALNTRQSSKVWKTSYFFEKSPKLRADTGDDAWENFIPPASALIRHGKLVSDDVHEQIEKARKSPDEVGWQEWAEPGQDPRNQRAKGLYSPSRHTITYFFSNGANLGSSVPSAPASGDLQQFDLLSVAGGASVTQTGNNLQTDERQLYFIFVTSANEPGTTTWPTGDYRINLNVTATGGNINYGLGPVSDASGGVIMADAGLTTIRDQISSTSSVNSGTGLKLMVAASAWTASPAATDRCEWLIAAERDDAAHGNETITFHGGDSDAFVDGAWTVAVPVAQFSSLSAMMIGDGTATLTQTKNYGGPYLFSGQLYVLGIGVNSNEVMNFARTISAPITTRDNWSATWDGVSLTDDVRGYDTYPILNGSAIATVTYTSLADVAYHEFHLSNNTWGISNQGVASAGVGNFARGLWLGTGIVARGNGDKIIAAVFSNTTSARSDAWYWIQSATTAWTQHATLNTSTIETASIHDVALLEPSTADGNRTFAIYGAGHLIQNINSISSTSSLGNANGGPSVGGLYGDSVDSLITQYCKGSFTALDHITMAAPGFSDLREQSTFFHVSDVMTTAIDQYDSATDTDLSPIENATTSGSFGGTVHASEIVCRVYVVNTGDIQVDTLYGRSSGHLFSNVASFNTAGTTRYLHHNLITLQGTSYGSGMEAVIFFDDNHSSVDIIAMGVDLNQEITIASPAEGRWLTIAPTIDLGGVQPGLGAVTPAVEARWLVVAPTIDFTAPGVAQFPSLSNMEIAASTASMTHIYGGPYFYSGQIYLLGIGKNSNDTMNIVRSLSGGGFDSGTSTRDLFSSPWDGVSFVDDVRAYDSIVFNDSTIAVAVQVSQGDTTYHEFHLSNNTWGTSNQPIASAGVGGIANGLSRGIAIAARGQGDKVVGTLYSHTTSSLDQAMIYIQSGTTAWTSQGPAVARAPATQEILAVAIPNANSEDELIIITGDEDEDLNWTHLDTGSIFASNFLFTATAVASSKGYGYHKGIVDANDNLQFVYAPASPQPTWDYYDVSTAPTKLGSSTRLVPVAINDPLSGMFGGIVAVSEVTVFAGVTNTSNIFYRVQYHTGTSAGLWSAFNDGADTGTNHKHIYHNVLSVAGTSYGSGLESFLVVNGNHSSIDIFQVHLEVAQTASPAPAEARWSVPAANTIRTVTPTPAEGRWLTVAPTINIGAVATATQPVEAQWLTVSPTIDRPYVNTITTPAEARWLTVAPTIDLGAVATATQPVEARWLTITPTIDLGEVQPGLGAVTPAVEARWLVVAPTVDLGGAPGVEVAQFSSLSAMTIAASAASMAHVYGGPYIYSGQVYLFGIGVNSNEVMNIARTISAPLTTRDNWSAAWDGVSLVDDIRAYDSILFNTSIIGVAIQVSQSDTTYNEFHLSNNTWGISNQPIASGGAGGLLVGAAKGISLTRRGSDKVVTAIYAHTVSTLEQVMVYVQSATTAWASQGPADPLRATNAIGVIQSPAASDDDLIIITNDTGQDLRMIHMDGSTSAFASAFNLTTVAAVSVKSILYTKGLNAANDWTFTWFVGAQTMRAEQFDISTVPTRLASSTRITTTTGDDIASGFFGGAVQVSEINTAVYVTGTNNANNGIRTNFHGESSEGLWSHMATGIPVTGAVQHMFHNVLDLSSDVGVTSFGSGMEILIAFNDNHSSIDIVAVGVEVAQEITITTPVEAQWSVPAPTIVVTPKTLNQTELPNRNYDVGPYTYSNFRYSPLINRNTQQNFLAMMKASNPNIDTDWIGTDSSIRFSQATQTLWSVRHSGTTRIYMATGHADGRYLHHEFETSNDTWTTKNVLIAEPGDTNFPSAAASSVEVNVFRRSAGGELLAAYTVESAGDLRVELSENSNGSWNFIGELATSLAGSANQSFRMIGHNAGTENIFCMYARPPGGAINTQNITSANIIGAPGGADTAVNSALIPLGLATIQHSAFDANILYIDNDGLLDRIYNDGSIRFDNDVGLGQSPVGATATASPFFQAAIRANDDNEDLHIVFAIPTSGGQLIHRHKDYATSGAWSGILDTSTHDLLIAGSVASIAGMCMAIGGDSATSGQYVEVLFQDLTQANSGISYVQVLIAGGGAADITVSPEPAEARWLTVAPTLDIGAVEITVATPVEARWLTVAPTIDIGAVATATQPVEARWLTVAPTIDLGAVIATTQPVEARWLVIAPTIDRPYVNTITTPVEARWLTVAPTIDLGAVATATQPVEARWLTVAPTIDLGGVATATQPVEARWLVIAPTIDEGAVGVIVSPAPAEARWLIVTPTIDLGAVTTEGTQPAEARWLTVSPTIDIGEITATTAPAEARWLVLAPDIDFDVIVTPGPAEARWLTIAPTLDLGAVATSTQPIEAQWLVVAPTINQGRTVSPAPAEARWLTVAPTVDVGESVVTPTPAEAQWLIVAPTIDIGSFTTEGTQPAEARWLVPAANTIRTATPTPAEAQWLIVAPTIDIGAVEATTAPAEAQWTVPAPSIDIGAVTVTTQPAPARWLIPAPSITLGTVTISTVPVEARWLVNIPSVFRTGAGSPQTITITSPAEARWLIVAPTLLNQKIIQLTPFVLSVPTSATFVTMSAPGSSEFVMSAGSATFELTMSLKGT
jgi:hypothetical protein